MSYYKPTERVVRSFPSLGNIEPLQPKYSKNIAFMFLPPQRGVIYMEVVAPVRQVGRRPSHHFGGKSCRSFILKNKQPNDLRATRLGTSSVIIVHRLLRFTANHINPNGELIKKSSALNPKKVRKNNQN
jgi:hypothetical protein